MKMCADPLATDDERELIAAELARVQAGPRERRQSAALVGVIFCWFCESALSSTIHKRNGRVYQYYRCHTNRCTSIPAEAAEERAEEELLRTLGDEDITERVWMRGDSNETELRTALAAFEELSAAAGKLTSRTAKDRLQRQLAALDARIAELESMPAREGRTSIDPPGRPTEKRGRRTPTPTRVGIC